MNTTSPADPFTVLGVPREASEEQIRARYLELVKQHPPDREPEKFREVRAAFEAAKDPLLIARRLIEPPGEEPPSWSEALEKQKRIPPRLSTAFLLSLGNRDPKQPFPSEANRDPFLDETKSESNPSH
jgi:curved DNA-binding protein CbpA